MLNSFRKLLRKMTLALILAAVLLTALPARVMADTPFQGFRYNFWGQLTPSPAAYVPIMAVRAQDICPSLGEFINPRHFRVDRYDNIYVSDTGNNRIVVFDLELNLVNVIDSFILDGSMETFDAPQGIFISDNLDIHIADTGNNRIVTLDRYGSLVRVLESPQSDILPEDFIFIPLQVLVGRDDVTYVIARHVFEGIMVFDRYGEFLGYHGTIRVLYNALDILWRSFMTAEQRARQRLFIPTEFLGMDIDEYGFIYTVNAEHMGSDRNLVMRLNPRGEDVLRNFNEDNRIIGTHDWIPFGLYSGPSVFIDIVARENGVYSALDTTRNRVYTYDSEGNLLYVFSGIGNIGGMTHSPVAIDAVGDYMMILDAHRGQIIVFEPTLYGRLINEAIALQYRNDDVAAVELWRELITMDEHFALAFAGVGRAYFAAGNYRLAMEYLRRGMDLRYYSLAFVRHRTTTLHGSLEYVLNAMVVGIGILILYKIYKAISASRRKKVRV